jgi:hypothetical protein
VKIGNFAFFIGKTVQGGLFKCLVLCEEKRNRDSNGKVSSYDEPNTKLYEPDLGWLSLPAIRIERNLILAYP